MTKVFVGNFSFAVTEEHLKEFFSQVGTVISAKVMIETQTGRSRGFGFVELSSPEEATKAISDLDGSTWEGRVIKVSEDRSGRRTEGQGTEAGHTQTGDTSSNRGGHVGYFRAQPLELGIKRRKKLDPFIEDSSLVLDYKDAKLLMRFMSERGRILPRRMTGLGAYNQRQVTRAIKRAQHIGLLPISKA